MSFDNADGLLNEGMRIAGIEENTPVDTFMRMQQDGSSFITIDQYDDPVLGRLDDEEAYFQDFEDDDDGN